MNPLPLLYPETVDLVATLAACDLFIRFRRAFREATGRLVRLTNEGDIVPPYPGLRIPLIAGGRSIGFLSLDPYRIIGESGESFEAIVRRLQENGATRIQLRATRKAYSGLPAISMALAQAVETMLQIFSGQLGDFAEKAFLQATDHEPTSIRRARDYIRGHLAGEMTLEEVATHAGVSLFHFCKVFKRNTGHTFTDFVTRARIEEAKRLLLHPRLRVTEVAYEVGFQSLSQFNRSFRKVTSLSPTEYRGAGSSRAEKAA